MENVSSGTTVAVEVHPRMRWGAIFAGWAVSIAVAALLSVGGLALGFSVFDANDAAATSKGIGIGTAAWVVLTWAAALFVGAMFASWFDGNDDETMGTLHGVTVWGLSVVASALIAVIAAGNVVGAGASAVGGGTNALLSGYGAGASGGQVHQIMTSASHVLRAEINKGIRDASNTTVENSPADANPDMEKGATGTSVTGQESATPQPSASRRNNGRAGWADGGASAAAAAALIAGDKQSAHQILAAETGMSSTQIDALIQAQTTRVEQFKAKAKAAADQVAKYTAMAMWIAFASLLIGLLAAAFGGWLGSSGIHRVYHLRTYRRSAPARS